MVVGFLCSFFFLVPIFLTHDLRAIVFCLAGALFSAEMVIGPMWSIPMDIAGKFSGTAAGMMNTGSALAAILSWQDLDQLFAVARFVGVSRPGYELAREHLADVLDGLPDDALTLVEIPALAISSTDCRRRAEEGRPLWYLMPDGVVQYISKRELYRKPGDDT